MSNKLEQRHIPPDFGDDDDDDDAKEDQSMFVSASLPPTDDIPLDEDDENPFGTSSNQPAKSQSISTTDSTATFESPSVSSIKQENPIMVEQNSSSSAMSTETKPPTNLEQAISSATADYSTVSTAKAKTKRRTEYKIEILVSDPSKVGEGISSYMTYRITTKTSLPMFKKSEFSVNRRFSDFLGLHNRLVNKHLQMGVILPSPPEKDSLSMAKVKMSKEESIPNDFIDRRRSQLERYLNRLARHEKLVQDPDFRDFIELVGDLPKSNSTQALSGAGVLRALSNISNQVTKLTTKTSEQDQWFEEKHNFFDDLHTLLKQLYNNFQSMFNLHKEAAQSMKSLSASLNHLATIEEHTLLSSALIELANVQDKLEQIQVEHSLKEFSTMTELLKEYVALLEMVQLAFQERIKLHQQWLNAEETLKKKRETKIKLEQTPKGADKLPQVEMEINEWEGKVVRSKEDFQRITNSIKEEVQAFEQSRIEDFQVAIEQYLKLFLEKQEKVLDVWQNYLPEANKIAV